jgi:hypothetical protein
MVYFLGTYSFIILIFKQNIVFKVWVGAPAVQKNLVYARACPSLRSRWTSAGRSWSRPSSRKPLGRGKYSDPLHFDADPDPTRNKFQFSYS